MTVSHPLVLPPPTDRDSSRTGPVPTPLDVDPWWDVYLPALHGYAVPAIEAGERALAAADPERWGDVATVVARALFALGRHEEAQPLLARALAEGGIEADRIAVLVAPDGRRRGLELARSGLPRGERADVACDLAARCLWEEDPDAAQAAVRLARLICPDHREAAHWARLLAVPDFAVGAMGSARRRAVPAAGRAQRDADALAPLRTRGFVSEERLRRRLLGVGVGQGARPGPALVRLGDAGLTTLRFGFPHEYRRLPADAPRVSVELAADHALALLAEGRDPSGAARMVWRAALRDPEVELEAARLVLAIAARDRRAAPLGLDVLPVLRAGAPGEALRWLAAEALVGRGQHPERSARLARSVLREVERLGPSGDAARMALDTLRRLGHVDEATRIAGQLAERPALRGEMEAILAEDASSPPPGVFLDVLPPPSPGALRDGGPTSA